MFKCGYFIFKYTFLVFYIKIHFSEYLKYNVKIIILVDPYSIFVIKFKYLHICHKKLMA